MLWKFHKVALEPDGAQEWCFSISTVSEYKKFEQIRLQQV